MERRSAHYLLYPSLFLLLARGSESAASEHLVTNTTDEGSLVVVSARRGATARLPCAITSSSPLSEPPLLVLWYRGSSVTPAYSYDSRTTTHHSKAGESGSGRSGRQWADEEAWGGGGGGGGVQRAWLNTSATPAHLVIRGVRGRDEGVYRCVVHFRAAPTWAQQVTLSVKDPPGFPRLQDESGRRLEGPIGPYEEGEAVRVVCIGVGEPPPRLEWGGAAGRGGAREEVVLGKRITRITFSLVASRALYRASITCSSYTPTSSSSSPSPYSISSSSFSSSSSSSSPSYNISSPSSFPFSSSSSYNTSSPSSSSYSLLPSSISLSSSPYSKISSSSSSYNISHSISSSSSSTLSSASSASSSSSSSSSSRLRPLFTATAFLMLNLPPLEVRLEAPRGGWVAAGQVATFRCVVVGCAPPPVIQWRLGGRRLNTHTALHRQEGGNVSISSVRVRPQHTDDMAALECRAFSPRLPSQALQHHILLSVRFVPVITLAAGKKEGEAVAVPQGSSVTFTCRMKANPPVFNVTWFHNGRPLSQPASAVGAINATLYLANLTEAAAGLYTCVGSNVEGDGQSNALHLDVTFRPVCASSPIQPQVYEVSAGADVTLRCEVKANPPPLTFTWALKNTADGSLTRLLTARRGRKSLTGRYTLRGVTRALQVLCWARNAVGTQVTPCKLTVRTHSVHSTLGSCSVGNHTAAGFTVGCVEAASSRGRLFTLSVYSQETRRDGERKKNEKYDLKKEKEEKEEEEEEKKEEEEEEEEEEGSKASIYNQSNLLRSLNSSSPFFRVDDLRAGQKVVVVVKVVREGGISELKVLTTSTLSDDTATPNRIIALERPINATEDGADEGDGGGGGDKEGERRGGGKWDRMAPDGMLGFKLLVFFVFLSAVLALSAIATCVVRKRREVPARRGFGQMKKLCLSSHHTSITTEKDAVTLSLNGPFISEKTKKSNKKKRKDGEATIRRENCSRYDVGDGGDGAGDGDGRQDGIFYLSLSHLPPVNYPPPGLSFAPTTIHSVGNIDSLRVKKGRQTRARRSAVLDGNIDSARDHMLCRL